MKTNITARVASLVLFLTVCLAMVSSAQDLERFMVEPREGNPGIPHQDIVDTVRALGGEIYVDVDRPEVGGNMVGVLMNPLAAADLRNTRPDLIVIPDSELRPDAGAGAWSPDRIDQRVGTDGVYLPPIRLPCGENRPFVYVCDTGILGTHSEFPVTGTRLSLAGSYIPATLMLLRTSTAWQDPWDHGTGVASCAVGETLGSGRCPANLVSAVCYPDPGTFPVGSFASYATDVIYWCLSEHNIRATDGDPFNDASVLIFASSTTTGPSAILDLAIQRAYLGGMSVVVSAGNQNQDVANTSPAGAISGLVGDITLTVAGSDIADARWLNSNFGARVELFAPGENVPVASSAPVAACVLRSGTSYSAGYAGGAAARILSRNPWAPPADVVKVLTDHSDTVIGPSGPFGIGANSVPTLLYTHPSMIKCLPVEFPDWATWYELDPASALEDADCDGLTNGLEYFMGSNPLVWTPKEDRPSLRLGGGKAKYYFPMADYICETEMRHEVQYSTDLLNWTVVPSDSIVSDDDADCLVASTWMVATIPIDGERLYVRLVVSGL